MPKFPNISKLLPKAAKSKEDLALAKLLSEHPGMTEEMARFKIYGEPSEKIMKANLVGDEAINKLNIADEWMAKQRDLGVSDPFYNKLDKSKLKGSEDPTKTLTSSGSGGVNSAALAPKSLKNPYEGFDKKSLFYKDIPEQYQEEEGLEHPTLDPLDFTPTGNISKFGKLLKYLK